MQEPTTDSSVGNDFRADELRFRARHKQQGEPLLLIVVLIVAFMVFVISAGVYFVNQRALTHEAGASQRSNATRKPEQAGQPMDRVRLASEMARIEAAAVRGDQEAIRQSLQAVHEDFRKSIKLADPGRSVDREMARVAAKTVPGVRSVVWFDRVNIFAIVERNEQKSYETIDAICLQLEPLGDTLGVVVNLQSGAARTGDQLTTLSRNCQLAPGDRALLQRERQVDVIDPAIRAQHRANQSLRPSVDEKTAAESLRIIEETTPDVGD